MTEQKTVVRPAAFFSLMKFVGSFCIVVFLHYNDHFLPMLGMENPFAGNALLWNISHYSYVLVEMYFIISGILFAWAYKDRIIARGGSIPS